MVPGGLRTPTRLPSADLSLILGVLQGVASRRTKSQQASYLHADKSQELVAMRRSQKQKSWERTAIKTATKSCTKNGANALQHTAD